MTIALRKQLVELAQKSWNIQNLLSVLSILLVLLKKFWKQMSQSPIQEFVQQHYADAYQLYQALGAVRLSVKDCLKLQQHLYEALGEDTLIASASDASVLQSLTAKDLLVQEWGTQDPGLRISNSNKLYKRSLSSDLQKLL